MALFVALPCACAARLGGKITDPSGASVVSAAVTLRLKASGTELFTTTRGDGSFEFTEISGGTYVLTVAAEGFSKADRTVSVNPVDSVDVVLQPATLAQHVVVHANAIAGPDTAMREIPGSVEVLDAATLIQSRVFTFDEALRKVTGVYTRGEEGFGLRPNIGIRGLNPTRSSKVLLLEDGVPISYAPYGDNASYYHPPVDRFESIEVVKGAGQILYGPSTIGGVINYLTPAPPDRGSGFVTLTGGNLDYFNGHAQYGNTFRGTGVLFDFMRKQGDGARENTHFALNDVTAKVLRPVGFRQTLAAKFNSYIEDSQITYSGLREAEWATNPRMNAFRNDGLEFNRYGGALTHTLVLTPNGVLTTTGYGQFFTRDWWRQSSNSAQRPNDAADPACGGMANLLTTCGNEGRLREYSTWGVQSKLRAGWNIFGQRNEIDLGFRAHFENQDRLQKNGPLPTSRDGVLVESNVRTADAWSGFVQNRFVFGKWGITPGVRVERVRYARINRLLNVSGATDLTQIVPGVGISCSPSSRLTAFAGVHRGFAPPRAEDVINNSTGGVVDLDSELSWNYEAGLRARLHRSTAFEATWFRMDFSNQIIPASVAGGVGATLISAGRTIQQGAELSGRTEFRNLLGSRHSAWIRGAWTWVPTAEFASRRFSTITGFAGTPVIGNRVPYTPSQLGNASVGYTHSNGLNALVEGVYTARHYTDDLNTINPSPDGQRGRIPSSTIFNATLNYPVEAWHTTFFVSAKNLTDRLYIVDRARGLLPGMPRLVHVGMRFSF